MINYFPYRQLIKFVYIREKKKLYILKCLSKVKVSTLQKQIKITVSEEAMHIVEKKAYNLGMTKAAYCYNILFEHIRKEMEANKK